MREVVPRGKHLLVRLADERTLRTHFRMDGAWQVVGPGKRLPRTFDDEIRLVLHTDGPTTAPNRPDPSSRMVRTVSGTTAASMPGRPACTAATRGCSRS